MTSLIWLTATALASDPVVHPQGEPDPIGRAVATTSRLPEDFHLATLDELMAGREPTGVGAIDFLECEGSPVNEEEFAQLVDTVERLVLKQSEAVDTAFEQAEQSLRCLREPLVPRLAADLYLQRGVNLVRRGDEAAALDAFHQALVFDVGLRAVGYEPAVTGLFDEAVAATMEEVHEASIAVLPHPGEDSVWIDGRELAPGIGVRAAAAGRHLVQILRPMGGGLYSGEVVLGPSDRAMIAVPSAVTDEVLAWVVDPERSGDLAALLTLPFETGDEVFLVVDGEVYRGVAGGLSLERQGVLDLGAAGRGLRIGGASAAVVGAGLVGVAMLRAPGLLDQGESAQASFDRAGWQSARRASSLNAVIGYAGYGLGALGLAGVAIGLTPPFMGSSVMLSPHPGGLGARVEW